MNKIQLQPPFKHKQWEDPHPHSNRIYNLYPIRAAYPYWRAAQGRYTHIVKSGVFKSSGHMILTAWCGNSIGTAGLVAGEPSECFPLCGRCRVKIGFVLQNS